MVTKKLICLVLCVISYKYSYSQGQGISNNWFQGYGSYAGLPFGISRTTFISGSPVISYDSIAMEFNHTEANISDTAGNMLFYTNGVYIADATDDTMMNGTGINPGAYAHDFSFGFLIPQAALILPLPNSNHLYYMFHNTADAYPVIPNNSTSYFFYLSIIDMNLNGGLGAVSVKNQVLINDSMNVGKITACKHGNGRDWWIVTHRVNTNMFYKFLLTPDSLMGPYTQNIGTVREDDAGQTKFSPDGKRYAYYYFYNSGLDIFDFDRCTGVFNNPIHDTLPQEGGNVGCEFSPNSNVLYATNIDSVYQYDLTAANVLASRTVVAVYDSFYYVNPNLGTYLCLPQLAPDGKIYITTGNGSTYMHVINQPDSLGLACNLTQHSVLLPSLYFNTLPNPPNFFLGADTTSACDTLHVSIAEHKPEAIPKVFPNPTEGKFTLRFAVHDRLGLVQVYDVNGNLILQETVAQWSQYKHIDISKQPSGIYFCKMSWLNNGHAERSRSTSVKVIKQ